MSRNLVPIVWGNALDLWLENIDHIQDRLELVRTGKPHLFDHPNRGHCSRRALLTIIGRGHARRA